MADVLRVFTSDVNGPCIARRDGHLNLATTTLVRLTKIMLNIEINNMIINILCRYQSPPHSSN